MRPRLLTVLSAMALALAAPNAALAHHGHKHPRHGDRSRAHHAKFRILNIGPGDASSTSGSTAGAPTTTPPTTPAEEEAGTVVSFEKEVLTIKLKDGSTVSGKVTADTHIRCIGPAPAGEPGEEGEGDDQGQGDDQSRGDMSQSAPGSSSDDGGAGEDDGEQAPPEPPCDTSSLLAGAVVRQAQLRIGPAGGEFEFVELMRGS